LKSLIKNEYLILLVILLAGSAWGQEANDFIGRVLTYQNQLYDVSPIKMADLTVRPPEDTHLGEIGYRNLVHYWQRRVEDKPRYLFISRDVPKKPVYHKAGKNKYGLLYVEETYVDLKERAVYKTKETLVGVLYPDEKWRVPILIEYLNYKGGSDVELLRSNFKDFPDSVRFDDPHDIKIADYDPSIHPASPAEEESETVPPIVMVTRLESAIENHVGKKGDITKGYRLLDETKEQLGTQAHLTRSASLALAKYANYETKRSIRRLQDPLRRMGGLVSLMEIAKLDCPAASEAKAALAPLRDTEEFKQALLIANERFGWTK